MRLLVRALLVPALCVAGCGGEDTTRPNDTLDFGACSGGPIFTASPVAVADIRSVVPLGNLNPPGHTFPTDHMYFYLRVAPGADRPVVTPCLAPGSMTVSNVRASQHVVANLVDFSLTLRPCNDITVEFGHVASLAESLFGDTSNFDSWEFRGEYSTGGETYRNFEKQVRIGVHAGQYLGTAGGNPGQWALDVGVYDERTTNGTAANPARWNNTRYSHAACALDYYESGTVARQLAALLDRETNPGDEHPCGAVLQDIPGTAHGCWFRDDLPAPYPEDNHLALVWSNTRPSLAVLSVGSTVPSMRSGTFPFVPQATGPLNRPFASVLPDGTTYGCVAAGFTGVILLRMPDASTLWLEGIPGGSSDPATWLFTGSKSVFKR